MSQAKVHVTYDLPVTVQCGVLTGEGASRDRSPREHSELDRMNSHHLR